ncbi:MAG: right-handed parallel beta-helix repeat-containing protein [Anaerolineales bacterium]|nr:right-handed parallel beta-helix repeat-containing protein [Anaerolineales bacterium]
MKKIVHILISAAAVLALTILNYNNAAAQQTTKVLYISPTGNDVNTCTFSAPCKTFNRAQSLAVAGDTIQASGTFAPINITKSITVRGGTYDGAGQSESICVKINADNVTVDGVTALNCTSHGIISFKANAIIQNSTVKNSVLENASRQMNGGWASCIKGERGSVNLTVRNNLVENCYGEGIAITMTLGALVEGNTVIDAYSVLYYVDNSPMLLSVEIMAPVPATRSSIVEQAVPWESRWEKSTTPAGAHSFTTSTFQATPFKAVKKVSSLSAVSEC